MMRYLMLTLLLCVGTLPLADPAHAIWKPKQEIESLDKLLDLVQQGRVEQSKENKEREQRFLAQKSKQEQLLQEAIAERKKLERRSELLETTYSENKEQLDELTRRLEKRMGSLKELFTHLQASTSETANLLQHSITSVEYPSRHLEMEDLSDLLGSNRSLPSINNIEQLWFQMQREMVESGKIKHLNLEVITTQGEPVKADVVRVGAFNLLSGNRYLQYIPETGKVIDLNRQPARYMLGYVEDYTQATEGFNAVAIDPTRGTLLNMLLDAPDFVDRVEQGGFIGYVIIILGAIGVILALERIMFLIITTRKVSDQMRLQEVKRDNPLGRIMLTYEQHKKLPLESLELKLGEAILRERGPLEKHLTMIKIISVIAPLLGLLGTVTGMINTFQTITLFGTGDPKLMAGGISQALVTTVLGLSVAIPVVFFHTLASTRSKAVISVLEEQSTGLVAEKAEQENS
ncbi:MAG TPA: energy transducer TonB [Gammaproteobacteria bacterium]|jgi:biopolymer transport protein ExbB|nr:energy transducer TonB [Pseudomonadales bacterium]MEC8812886.1 MotA/TolQ/ExbB proton channel family protein [Pseudomonadota bacterium]HAG92553.1 energy transducer TonB [Gammaproteobacteria bacterium]HAU13697.1 energy transducer TonB [Gammaproteobacteria bacterium]HBO93864.1 energy transducer TonB [Gammaproteobacteria bacterium]|tara:strand:+ start:2536 stop:3918 length:1383 start_codon:yes stop_codon:yes gene_type:complete